jgi:hypothetical protein
VKKPVNRQLARGDGIGHRVYEEGHVIVDDADPHAPVPRLAARGFNCERELAPLPGRCNLAQELGGFALGLAAPSLGFTW